MPKQLFPGRIIEYLGRNQLDAVRLPRVRLLPHIDELHFQPPRLLLLQLLQNGRHLLARNALAGPQVHQTRQLRLGGGIRSTLARLACHRAHGSHQRAARSSRPRFTFARAHRPGACHHARRYNPHAFLRHSSHKLLSLVVGLTALFSGKSPAAASGTSRSPAPPCPPPA
jgi:hypothetical protein